MSASKQFATVASDELRALLDKYSNPVIPTPGRIVEATYLGDGWVDFGGKETGRLHTRDIELGAPEVGVKLKFQFTGVPEEDEVTGDTDPNKFPVLSRYSAEQWLEIQRLKDENVRTTVQVLSIARYRGGKGVAGLKVALGDLKLTIPRDELGCETREIGRFVGKPLDVYVREVNLESRRVELDYKTVLKDEEGRKAAAFDEVKRNDVVTGTVLALIDKGVLVELPSGLVALALARELPTGFTAKPGDSLEAVVISKLPEMRHILLSVRQASGKRRSQAYGSVEVGATITGKVVRLATYGVFVDIGNDVQGLLHWENMKDGSHPSEYAIDQEVTVNVREVNSQERRVSLTTVSAS